MTQPHGRRRKKDLVIFVLRQCLQKKRVNTSSLLYAMAPEVDRIKTFELTERERKNDATVLRKFDEHYIPHGNVIYVRA